MKKKIMTIMVVLSFLIPFAALAFAHCEIPCGIYDDKMRIKMIGEHITTIEKSMNQIIKLEKETPPNSNQLTRWIINKERHANKLQRIVTQYFMTQRIKPDAKAYDKKIALLHQMLVAAMKCKQTTDLKHIEKLKSLLNDFQTLYLEGK